MLQNGAHVLLFMTQSNPACAGTVADSCCREPNYAAKSIISSIVTRFSSLCTCASEHHACRYGRRRPFLSAIGRLDKETSGLLLLTDDGKLLHSIQSPARGEPRHQLLQLPQPVS
jgi:hypothetical protein